MTDIRTGARLWFYRLVDRFPKPCASICLAIIVLAHGMAADHGVKSFDAWYERGSNASFDLCQLLIILFSLAVFCVASWTLWSFRENILRMKATVVEADKETEAVAALILTFSPNNKLEATAIAIKKLSDVTDPQVGPLSKLEAIISTDLTVLDPAFFKWNWQQPLRAIASEMRRAEQSKKPIHEIIVIVSDDREPSVGKKKGKETGSEPHFDQFKLLVEVLFQDWPFKAAGWRIRKGRYAIRQGAYQATYDLICEEIDVCRRQYENRKICVDVTGGITEFSVAGAIATLNRNMSFSYVNHAGKSYLYDARVTGVEPPLD
jgi:hypothetical protein